MIELGFLGQEPYGITNGEAYSICIPKFRALWVKRNPFVQDWWV